MFISYEIYEVYADDYQLYVTFDPNNLELAISKMDIIYSLILKFIFGDFFLFFFSSFLFCFVSLYCFFFCSCC